MNHINPPRLAPPGAGLPLPELLVARCLLALSRLTTTREAATAYFEKERLAIRPLVETCNEEIGSRRVLISRPRGLEDSSRFWSVWMTLDHLRIVNHVFARCITSLSAGVVPEGRASTAEVKPLAEVDGRILAEYESSCDALLSAVTAAPQWRTEVKFAHPWFGPMDASAWHILSGRHMRIHRVQIERILEGQSGNKA